MRNVPFDSHKTADPLLRPPLFRHRSSEDKMRAQVRRRLMSNRQERYSDRGVRIIRGYATSAPRLSDRHECADGTLGAAGDQRRCALGPVASDGWALRQVRGRCGHSAVEGRCDGQLDVRRHRLAEQCRAAGLLSSVHGFVYCDIEVPITQLALYVPVGRIHAVAIPNWLTVAALAALPLARATTYLYRRRKKVSGVCRACGYDLRATPGRCPECGAVAAPEALA
jgi:hypothetical protein